MLTDYKKIQQWLKKVKIKNYTINEDLTVDVHEDVDLRFLEIDELPVQFNIVEGDFDCSGSRWKTLKGCPSKIKDSFYCNNNGLKSLEYGPKEVGMNYSCQDNNLISLKGVPDKIKGNLDCTYNHIENLFDSPKEILGYFGISNNKLLSFKGIPDKIGDDLYCTGNRIESFEFMPKEIVGCFSLEYNNIDIATLKFFDCSVGGEITSDFGSHEVFLNLVKEQKAYAEKEEIENLILKNDDTNLNLRKRI